MSDIKEKWNIGKFPSIVVSNKKQKNEFFPVPANPAESKDEELEYYGGYLVCESIGNTKARNLIAAAPELLEMVELLVDRLEENGLGNFNAVKRAKELIDKTTN